MNVLINLHKNWLSAPWKELPKKIWNKNLNMFAISTKLPSSFVSLYKILFIRNQNKRKTYLTQSRMK